MRKFCSLFSLFFRIIIQNIIWYRWLIKIHKSSFWFTSNQCKYLHCDIYTIFNYFMALKFRHKVYTYSYYLLKLWRLTQNTYFPARNFKGRSNIILLIPDNTLFIDVYSYRCTKFSWILEAVNAITTVSKYSKSPKILVLK